MFISPTEMCGLNQMALNREISTDEYLGTFRQSTDKGEKRERVLSLVDKLYRDGAIGVDMWMACGTLRNMIMMEVPPSEGVSSYGQSVKASEPSTKADRVGRRHTGFEIQPDGELLYAGGRKSRRNERALEDALVAACGVYDRDSRRRINMKHADILMRAVCDTEAMPTLTGLTLELTTYYGAKSKQAPPFALGMLSGWLGRLVLHFKETRMG